MILTTALIFIGALCNSVMDKISFHHSKSVFKNMSDWWNPQESWKFKWKNGNKEEGERFWQSSRLLVGFTDAWHAMKFGMRWSYLIAIPLYTMSNPLINIWVDFAILGVIQLITFHMFFTYFLSKKEQDA
tara:strand:- start:209 stop:598 length:390 start_codon:yes stop_codon:yes gene_type:complete